MNNYMNNTTSHFFEFNNSFILVKKESNEHIEQYTIRSHWLIQQPINNYNILHDLSLIYYFEKYLNCSYSL